VAIWRLGAADLFGGLVAITGIWQSMKTRS
jgi:hypothetical protein